MPASVGSKSQEEHHVVRVARAAAAFDRGGDLPQDALPRSRVFEARKSVDTLRLIDEARLRGVDATLDQYPYTAPNTTIRRRDLGIKRQLFDRGGVREYWVVDPNARALTVYRRAPGGSLSQIEPLSASSDATLSTPLLPGFSLSLTNLFA